ncbi:HEXXH motif-containing putative peptide modification protein [Actinoplanes sp. NBRC 103695]|uniref:aKG-HExxH-type peptide beta-hydroxylase n=1 Tax=Actinoplanes sp. NBRC 103695 TaxID=3032202 RepID=UPI0024A53FC9|nr:HEXXH motif-containing putative peptide modification protein [Actinoplanes sp. NBRC 103695]GLY97355.1 hypothetical protein Acsp02_46090 [Actinoplanes sp. NBRC 103695]
MRRHALTDSDFTALGAGRPSPHVIDELRRGQRGRNLLLLRALAVEAYPEIDLADPLLGAWAAARLRNRITWPAPAERPAVRFLTAEHDKIIISVRLDDRDERRGLLGLTPSPPLTDAEADHWQRCLSDAWRLLVTRHRPAAHRLADVLTCIVPVESDAGAAGISATSADAFGAVAMSRPADPTGLAVALLHEAQHSLLNATAYLFDLHEEPRARGYSPWRDDPRPTSGILHGAYAYLAVTRFWRTESRAGGDPLATFEFCRWREAVATTAERLLATVRLTAAGRRFTGALLDEVRPWLAEPADPRITRLARVANDDHYVRWRLRNMRPDVDALLTAYRRGDPPPPVTSRLVTDDRRALSHSPRLREIHALLRRDAPVDNSAELSDPSATLTPAQRGGGGGGGRDPRKIDNRTVETALLAGDNGTVRHAYTGKDLDLELTALIIAGGVGARAEEVAALVAAGSDAVAVVDWIVG